MQKRNLSNALEIVKAALDIKSSHRIFHPLCTDFAALYLMHDTLLSAIDTIMHAKDSIPSLHGLDALYTNVEANKQKILEVLCALTARNIIVHKASVKDSVWKISKTYDACIREMNELNGIKSIFRLEEGRVILVPIAQGI